MCHTALYHLSGFWQAAIKMLDFCLAVHVYIFFFVIHFFGDTGCPDKTCCPLQSRQVAMELLSEGCLFRPGVSPAGIMQWAVLEVLLHIIDMILIFILFELLAIQTI